MDAGIACWAIAGACPAAETARRTMTAAHAALTRASLCIALPPSWNVTDVPEEDGSGRGRATSFCSLVPGTYGVTFLTVTLLITRSSFRFPAALMAKSHPQVFANAARNRNEDLVIRSVTVRKDRKSTRLNSSHG